MDKIIVEYQLKTEELRKELGDVKKQLSDTEKQVETSGSKMSNTFKNVGKAIAGAFAIREIVQFGQEAIRLAATMEGVEAAFNRLGNPNLLNELRKATKGTVSDLQLMQNAVKANNFQIPLDQLGKMFSFAAMRARETGESVDYLVESITLGIARKSIPILDNLGISSIQIQEEFKKTGDFAKAVGNIIDESMGNAGETVETTAERMERFSASFQNFKANIGADLLPLMDVLLGALEDVGDAAVFVQDKMLELFNFLGSQKAKNALESEEARKLVDSYLQMGLTVEELTFKQRQLQDGLASIPKLMQENRTANNNNRESYEELVKAQDSMKVELSAVNTVLKIMNTTMTGSDDGSGDGGTSGALKELKYDFDKLYPPVDALTKAMTAFGEAFAIMRQSADGIYVGFGVEDLERTAAAIGAQAEGLELLKGTTAEYVDTTQEAADWTGAWFDISRSVFQGLNALSDQQTQKYINNLQAQLDAGQITQEQFEKQRTEALRKQAKQDKQYSIFRIILDTASAVINFLTAKPPNVPASVAAGVAGAIQLGVAVNAPVPAFAEGVVGLNGDGTETSDSILARLSKGESVITAKGTRQDRGLFEAANKMKLEEYINKNYVLPVLLKKQQDDKAMFDDYRLYRSLQDLRHSDKANTRMIVNAIKTEKVNSRRYWA
jgi:peroxiredoxin family protein/ribosomal protein L29